MLPSHTIHDVAHTGLAPWLPALGALRIRVFREYPYLYDGNEAYEREYLSIYRNSQQSRTFLVTDAAGSLVGATTCLPLEDEGEEFQAPFLAQGHRVEDICYFGESILLPKWRGQGLGKTFFRLRENHARAIGKTHTAFCAVDRPGNHPRRPAGYRPLDSFWIAQGYTKQPDLRAVFHWKEIEEPVESPKSLTFWIKCLG